MDLLLLSLSLSEPIETESAWVKGEYALLSFPALCRQAESRYELVEQLEVVLVSQSRSIVLFCFCCLTNTNTDIKVPIFFL